MTTMTTTLCVGDHITSMAMLDALPVGTMIEHVNLDNSRYRKHSNGMWRNETAGDVRSSSDGYLSTNGENRIVELPPGLRVGQVVSREALTDLPVGSRIRSESSGREYTQQRRGHWVREDGHSPNFRRGITFTVLEVAEAEVQSLNVEFVEVQETITQFKQRFRTVTYGAALRASVSIQPLDEGMRRLDVPEYDPAIGMWVSPHDGTLLQRLPAGTVLHGKSGHSESVYGVGSGGELVYLFGTYTDIYMAAPQPFRVVTLPDSTEAPAWVTEAGGDLDREQIEEFKQQAWNFGHRAKNTYGWCGDFESAMSRLGIGGDNTGEHL